MATIFIFHGIEGNPQENWFPWLKTELETLGHKVLAPKFPNPNTPLLDEWTNFFEKLRKDSKEEVWKNTILIGHSLSVAFILSILEKHKADAAFLVAGFTGKMDNQFAPRMTTFTERNFDWNKIKNNCPKFFIYNSNNDPYVKPEKPEKIAKNLGVNLITIKEAGHFNTASGYTKFELLLNHIKNSLNKK